MDLGCVFYSMEKCSSTEPPDEFCNPHCRHVALWERMRGEKADVNAGPSKKDIDAVCHALCPLADTICGNDQEHYLRKPCGERDRVLQLLTAARQEGNRLGDLGKRVIDYARMTVETGAAKRDGPLGIAVRDYQRSIGKPLKTAAEREADLPTEEDMKEAFRS